ncbi:MAG: phage tail tube protein [Rhodospirillales bacterium]|nr:phage tail tube protein [Rhodospirillales bacterium]
MSIANAGVLGLKVGGVEYATGDTAKYSTQTREVESVAGGKGRIGRSTKGAIPFIEVEVYLAQGQSADDLVSVREETVILSLEDRTVTLSEADFVGKGEPDGAKNSLTARFEGTKGVEVF